MPLPLYGSGLRTLADLGGELADRLLVGAGHVNLGRPSNCTVTLPGIGTLIVLA